MPGQQRRVLVVCTANVCRSPVAERLLQRELDRVGVDALVTSAGTIGGRLDPHPYTIEAARFTNIDLTDHRSRELTAEMVRTEGADLVLGMAREHLRAAITFDPDCWPHAFTLRELARRSQTLAARPHDWESWLAACHVGRNRVDLIVPEPIDDLPDAYGRPMTDHIMMAQEIAGATALIADTL